MSRGRICEFVLIAINSFRTLREGSSHDCSRHFDGSSGVHGQIKIFYNARLGEKIVEKKIPDAPTVPGKELPVPIWSLCLQAAVTRACKMTRDGLPNSGAGPCMVTVKPITPPDACLFKAVRLRALQDAPQAFGSTYQRESQFSDSEWLARVERMNGERGIGFLAMDGETACDIVGAFLDQNDPTRAQLVSTWTSPTHHEQGIGRLLVAEVLKWARARDAHTLLLMVTSHNQPAINFYQRLGLPELDGPNPIRMILPSLNTKCLGRFVNENSASLATDCKLTFFRGTPKVRSGEPIAVTNLRDFRSSFPENREICREFSAALSRIVEFCPKSANSVGEQGISREFVGIPATQQQLWT